MFSVVFLFLFSFSFLIKKRRERKRREVMAMLKMKLTVHVLSFGKLNETLFYLRYEVRSHEHVHHF